MKGVNVIKTRKYTIVLIVFIALLSLGIGYALVTTNFNIGGTVSTQSPSDDINDTSNLKQNFIVNWNDTVKEIDYSNAYGAEANVSIDKNTKTVTINVASLETKYLSPSKVQGLVYNNDYQALITPGNVVDGTMYYKVEGSEWSKEIPYVKDAGTYTVYYKVVGNKNYADIEEQS